MRNLHNHNTCKESVASTVFNTISKISVIHKYPDNAHRKNTQIRQITTGRLVKKEETSDWMSLLLVGEAGLDFHFASQNK
jgi:hypothetical protein